MTVILPNKVEVERCVDTPKQVVGGHMIFKPEAFASPHFALVTLWRDWVG